MTWWVPEVFALQLHHMLYTTVHIFTAFGLQPDGAVTELHLPRRQLKSLRLTQPER